MRVLWIDGLLAVDDMKIKKWEDSRIRQRRDGEEMLWKKICEPKKRKNEETKKRTQTKKKKVSFRTRLTGDKEVHGET